MNPYSEPAERVARGVAMLDADHGGPAWRGLIDLGKLDIDSCTVCVLGQVYGIYDLGLAALELVSGRNFTEAVENGFLALDYPDAEALTKAWKAELARNPEVAR